VDDDTSVILGTQRDETNSIFRRPLPQHQSTNINKRNSARIFSVNTNDDSQITAAHTLCTTNISENEKISIFDVETQKFENRDKTTCSIHDMETQEFSGYIHVEANANITELSVNIPDQTTSSTDIRNMETQNNIDEDGNNIRKFKNARTRNQENLHQIQQNIHDLETQKLEELGENERVINDIYDAETQLELDCNTNATKNTETQSKSRSIIDDQVDKDDNKNNTANAGLNEINTENIKNMPKSRSSSPASLNLSSPGVDDDGPSSLNDSTHLLETTDLLEYFSEGIDKHEEIRASNASTPKLCKEALSKTDNNVETVLNALDKEDNEEDIFDAPTQRISNKLEVLSDEIDEKAFEMCKMSENMREKSTAKQDNSDDSETDAEEYLEELAKEQRESASISRKLCNENISNNNDPGTSGESEDMFDMPTQRTNLVDDVQDISNPSTNHQEKIDESNIISHDMATQIIKKIKDEPDQDERLSPDINDVPTQLLSHRTLKTATISRSLSSNDDENYLDETNITTDDNIIRSPNLRALEDNYENADYELAPTQVISEVENEKKRNFGCEKQNLDDTLEQNLNKMFENVTNDNIQEPQQISTQCLENILESSQCDNNLSSNEFVANLGSLTNNTSQIQYMRKSHATNKRSLYDQSAAKTSASNINNAESVSQNSDIYFSTLSTRRKRNVLRDTQEFEDSVNEIISPRQNTNSSKQTKINIEKIDDDNIITRSNRESKRTRKNKMKSDDVNKTVLNVNNERKLRKPKMKGATTATSETDKEILEGDFDETKVNDPIKDSTSDPNIYIPCPLEEQSVQTSDTLYESDDNILTRLPAVRISGTLSNPASPSGSSISISLHRSKQNTTTKRKNKKSLKNKSLNKQDAQDTERDKNLNQTSDNKVSLLDNVEPTNVTNTSEDSDSEINFKRFTQMANRMYDKLHYMKCDSKRTTRDTKSAVLDKKKNRHSSSWKNVSEDSEQNTEPIELKKSLRVGTRTTRHSRQNDETHSHVLRKKLDTENTTDKGLKSERKSIVTNGKRFLTEENIEQTNSKKRKTHKVSNIEDHLVSMSDRRNTRKRTRTVNNEQSQSSNTSEHSVETNSHGNFPVSERFSADDKTTLEKTQKTSHPKMHENINFTSSRRARHKGNAATVNESSDITKQAPMKIEKIIASHVLNQNKSLKIVLTPIVGNESQEVEMIMGRDLSNVQNDNLSIKERSNVNILQRPSRSKSKKQRNANAEENSVIVESSASSITESDNPALKIKRGRFAKKDSAPLLSEIPKKTNIFKKPVIDSYLGNLSTSENSQDSIESNVSSSSRSSRSKTANKKKEKSGMHQDTIDDNISSRINNVGNMSLVSIPSTPTRTRRSTSGLNNSTLIAAKHKILFTGIREDYSKTFKILGKYIDLFYLIIRYNTMNTKSYEFRRIILSFIY